MKYIHKNKILTILVVAIAMIVPSVAMAQSDGGKKKKKARTEQSAPVKKRANKQQQTKQKPTTGTIAGHEWVDLGLPSGLKWATCNVGASSPEEYGDYFAWGEITTKSSYAEDNSKTYNQNFGDISGNPSYDAARANWGGTWRMPTQSECQELVDNCKWTWTTNSGHYGYNVTGKNGNSIFLPAGGEGHWASLKHAGTYGCYWSSSYNEEDASLATVWSSMATALS